MLTIKTTKCKNCADIPELLSDIDCKITEYSENKMMNLQYLTNYKYDECTLFILLQYKRILTKRMYCPDYASCITLSKIISRVKILLNK